MIIYYVIETDEQTIVSDGYTDKNMALARIFEILKHQGVTIDEWESYWEDYYEICELYVEGICKS